MAIKADLLINKRSRRSSSEQERLLQILLSEGFDIGTVYEITTSSTVDDAISHIKRRKSKLLIIGGGDGTVSTAISKLAGTSIEIGIIPLGTTNNLARSLNIDSSIEEAMTVIKNKVGRSIDLGSLDGKYFANVASVGLTAEIAKRVTNQSKQKWGRLAYAWTALGVLMSHRPFYVTIEDSKKNLAVSFETHQLIVANGRYHAGKEIATDARIDNGQLIVFALGGSSKLSAILSTIDFYVGKRKKIRHHSYLIGRDMIIGTDRVQLVELDGEVCEKTPIHVSVIQSAIKVRY